MNDRLPIDLAHPDQRIFWLSHPVVGDASFDSFEHDVHNPIYVGEPPFEWPVNAFLFQDPVGRALYAYVGLYPRGYWPAGGCKLLRSSDDGATWEDMGTVLNGDAQMFDGNGQCPGGMPDVSVVYGDGRYHMVYDWCNPDNSDGGIAYAWAERPEGPFHRAKEPIHRESLQPFLEGRYKRVYAPTLLRRENGWLILADMSTPGNAGGTWAMVGFMAQRPEGPYEGPTLLLWPQSRVYLPAPVEAYPAFAHDGYVYAPATSVALNRPFQVIYRARLQEAHRPEAWKIYQCGSVWHAEAVPEEASGIWGQTFSGLVDQKGRFRALFPSKTEHDVGTINLAQRSWERPYGQGFVISAPNGPSLSILQRIHSDLAMEVHLRSSGAKHLIWNHNAPIGSDRPTGAGGEPHTLTLADCTELTLDSEGWTLCQVDAGGDVLVLASGAEPIGREMICDVIAVEQGGGALSVSVNGQPLWSGPAGAQSGSIGFIAEAGSILYVDHLLVSQGGGSCCKCLLPTEGPMGSGAHPTVWQMESGSSFRYGFGFTANTAGATAKWNYRGRGLCLWSPRGPQLGSIDLYIDGDYAGEINLSCEEGKNSAPVFWRTDMAFGFHAVTLVRRTGVVVCDTLEIDL